MADLKLRQIYARGLCEMIQARTGDLEQLAATAALLCEGTEDAELAQALEELCAATTHGLGAAITVVLRLTEHIEDRAGNG